MTIFERYSIAIPVRFALRGMPLFLLLLANTLAFADVTGVVVGVADGDTVTVLDADKNQHKVRLAGIDAPEKAQPFGQRAKERDDEHSVFSRTSKS